MNFVSCDLLSKTIKKKTTEPVDLSGVFFPNTASSQYKNFGVTVLKLFRSPLLGRSKYLLAFCQKF